MISSCAAPVPAVGTAVRAPFVVGVALLMGFAGLLLAPVAWATEAPGQAWVRAAHAVPGLAGMTFTVTGGPDEATVTLADTAQYGTVSDYEALPPGDYTASVAPTGQPAEKTVLSTSFTVGPSSATTLAAVGTTDAPRLATLSDDLTPPETGTANVRILPAASAAPTVTVTAQEGPVIADAAVFGQATPYATVPAGRWVLDLASAGKTSTGTFDVEAGSVYTVVVVDDGDGGLKLLPVTDAAGTSQPDGSQEGVAAAGAGAAAPVGGVQTGGGGTATAADHSSPPWIALTAAVVLGALVARRRVDA